MISYPLSAVRADPVASSRSAALEFGEGFDGFVLHFDVDVTNLHCVDVPHPGGLDIESAFKVLEVLVRAPKCSAVVVTEFNADLDTDGSQSERLVDGLVGAFSP